MLEENKELNKKLKSIEEAVKAKEQRSQMKTTTELVRHYKASPSHLQKYSTSSKKQLQLDDRHQFSPSVVDFTKKVFHSATNQSSSKKRSFDFKSHPSKSQEDFHILHGKTISPKRLFPEDSNDYTRNEALNFSHDMSSSKNKYRKEAVTKLPSQKKFSRDPPLFMSQIDRQNRHQLSDSDEESKTYDKNTSNDKFLEYLTGNPGGQAELEENDHEEEDLEFYESEMPRRAFVENSSQKRLYNVPEESREENVQNSMNENLLREEIVDLDNEIAEIQRTLANEILKKKI